MRIVVAMDKFKGTVTAFEACAAVARGLHRARPDIEVVELPMADGGDGTLDVLLHHGYDQYLIPLLGAHGVPRSARVARQGRTTLIEVAEICGLGATEPTAEMAEHADSTGVGEAIVDALDVGASEIEVALGGSATSDGGAGMLRGLGARFLDAQGRPLAAGGSALTGLARIDWSGLDPRLTTIRLVGLRDVDSPVLGPVGAARRFGPQKGADSEAVDRLETGLAQFASVVAHMPPPTGFVAPDTPGSGAAGGLGWAILLLGGSLTSGGDRIAGALGLDEMIASSDAVITGEGRLDEQTLMGKSPAVVIYAARRHARPVAAVAGQNRLGEDPSRFGLAEVLSLECLASGTARDPALTVTTLERAGAMIAECMVRRISASASMMAVPSSTKGQ